MTQTLPPDVLSGLSLIEPPASLLQKELEFLGAQELTQACRNLDAEVGRAKPGMTLSCSRMAIAPTSGPNGETYSVYVSVRSEPPRA